MDFSFNEIMNLIRYIYILLMLIYQNSFSQEVEHNYLVGPQNTNCDSLNIQDLSFDQKLTVIEESIFRFDQKFKISRTSGVRAGHFYSCDGKNGYLVLTIGREIVIYEHVPKILWEDFIRTSDLDGFFESNIKKKFPVIRAQSP